MLRLAIVLFGTILAAACSDGTVPLPSGAQLGDPASLAGRRLVAASYLEGGRIVQLQRGTHLEISFFANSLGTTGGCNKSSGQYSMADGKLLVGEVSGTIVGCSAAMDQQDRWIVQFVKGAPLVLLVGDEVQFNTGRTSITTTDWQADPLVGRRWVIDASNPAVPVPRDFDMFLQIDDQGHFGFYSDPSCSGTFGYEKPTADRVVLWVFENPPRLACPPAIVAVFSRTELDINLADGRLTLSVPGTVLMFVDRTPG